MHCPGCDLHAQFETTQRCQWRRKARGCLEPPLDAQFDLLFLTHYCKLFRITENECFAVLLFCLLHGDICLGCRTRHTGSCVCTKFGEPLAGSRMVQTIPILWRWSIVIRRYKSQNEATRILTLSLYNPNLKHLKFLCRDLEIRNASTCHPHDESLPGRGSPGGPSGWAEQPFGPEGIARYFFPSETMVCTTSSKIWLQMHEMECLPEQFNEGRKLFDWIGQ